MFLPSFLSLPNTRNADCIQLKAFIDNKSYKIAKIVVFAIERVNKDDHYDPSSLT